MTTLILASLLMLVGAFVQGALGFGLAVVAAPFLFILDPDLVPGPVICVALVISLMGTWRYRSALSLKGLGMALLGRLPGGLAAVWLLSVASNALPYIIAASVLLAVVLSMTKLRLKPTQGNMFVAGFFSGLFGTASSIGGPPIALLMQHEAANAIRANLSAYFVVSCIISLAMLAGAGLFGPEQVQASLWLMPAGILGFLLAVPVSGHLKQHQFRPMLLGLCSLAAAGVLIQAVL